MLYGVVGITDARVVTLCEPFCECRVVVVRPLARPR
jgi:hypothetical protein